MIERQNYSTVWQWMSEWITVIIFFIWLWCAWNRKIRNNVEKMKRNVHMFGFIYSKPFSDSSLYSTRLCILCFLFDPFFFLKNVWETRLLFSVFMDGNNENFFIVFFLLSWRDKGNNIDNWNHSLSKVNTFSRNYFFESNSSTTYFR